MLALKNPTRTPSTSGEKVPKCGHVGMINPQEAKNHWHKLDEAIENLKKNANEEEI